MPFLTIRNEVEGQIRQPQLSVNPLFRHIEEYHKTTPDVTQEIYKPLKPQATLATI